MQRTQVQSLTARLDKETQEEERDPKSMQKSQRQPHFYCWKSHKNVKLNNYMCVEDLVQAHAGPVIAASVSMSTANLSLWALFSSYSPFIWLLQPFMPLSWGVPELCLMFGSGSLHLLQSAVRGSLSDRVIEIFKSIFISDWICFNISSSLLNLFFKSQVVFVTSFSLKFVFPYNSVVTLSLFSLRSMGCLFVSSLNFLNSLITFIIVLWNSISQGLSRWFSLENISTGVFIYWRRHIVLPFPTVCVFAM